MRVQDGSTIATCYLRSLGSTLLSDNVDSLSFIWLASSARCLYRVEGPFRMSFDLEGFRRSRPGDVLRGVILTRSFGDRLHRVAQFPFLFALATKNNLLGITGKSYERVSWSRCGLRISHLDSSFAILCSRLQLIFLHRFAGRSTLITALVHSACFLQSEFNSYSRA